MKKFFNIFPYVLLLLAWVLACTKDVTLITEVEFDLIEHHDQKGFVNQPLATTVTVVPEVELEDYSYSFTYSTVEGVGYFEDLKGKAYSLTEKIPFDPLTSSVMYKGTEKGTHTIKIEAQDNFGLKRETQITYTIIDVPVEWTATSPVSQIELGKRASIVVTLGVSEDGFGLSYEGNYSITANKGKLASVEGTALETDVYSAISAGSHKMAFTPEELGPATIEFRLRDSNGQEVSATLNFEVIADIVDTTAPELELSGANPMELFLGGTYTEPGATAIDDIDGDISDRISIEASGIDATKEGTYEVYYTVSDDDGNTGNAVRTVNVIRDPNGNAAPVANDDIASTGINEAASILVLQNDTDIDTEQSELIITAVSPHDPDDAGTLEFDSKEVRFVPSADFEGEVTFNYTITDGNVGNYANANVILSIADKTIAQTGIEVSPETLGLEVGVTRQLTARILPADATNQDVLWSSSDSDIATVDDSGNVGAIAPGTVTITATSSENSALTDSAVITVSPSAILVEGITVTRDRSSISDNETEQFTAVISPNNATNQTLSWTSDNADVATVDNTGLVTAVAEGVANISATAADGSGTSGSASITVTTSSTGIPVGTITVTRNRSSISDNEAEQFNTVITPENATNQTLSWTSDNADVATVDNTGLVTAVAEGVANINATATDGSGTSGSASITVTSNVILVSGITVNSARRIIQDDDTEQFTVEISPNNATDQTVVWSSDDTNVATVDANTGLVSGRSEGNVTIIATAVDGSGTTGSALLTVVGTSEEVPVNSITVSTANTSIAIGATSNFFAAVLPENATNRIVVWSSDAPNIASIDPTTGVATGVSEGMATITATATDGSEINGSSSIEVTPPLSDANDILFFSYPHVSGTPVIDVNNHTVDVKVFTGTDRTVAPRPIEVSEFATIDPGAIARDFYSPVPYTVTAQNGDEQIWTVTITEDTNNTKEITKFTINDTDGDIRGTDITVNMPPGTDLSALTPIIVHTGISVYPESGTQQDLRYQKEYIVKSSDGSEVIYTVNVKILQ